MKTSLCVSASLRETILFILSIAAALPAVIAFAATPTVETVIGELHRPCGVAVRPGGTADRFELFIAESGAGRVARWSSKAPKQVVEVISGFESQSAADLTSQTGPRALQFLDPGLLVVGTTQDKEGDLLRAYELPDGDKVLAADAATESTSKSQDLQGATCIALSRSRVNEFVPDRLFMAVHATDGQARLMSSRVQAGMLGTPQRFGDKNDAGPPRAVTMSNSGRVVVGDATGQLTFFSPIDGKVELTMSTELKNLVGLAYNAASGSLYAADFASGIYRIDDASKSGHPACQIVKVADVHQPSALSFAPDGSLYVVTFGDAADSGELAIVSGDL